MVVSLSKVPNYFAIEAVSFFVWQGNGASTSMDRDEFEVGPFRIGKIVARGTSGLEQQQHMLCVSWPRLPSFREDSVLQAQFVLYRSERADSKLRHGCEALGPLIPSVMHAR